MCGIAGILADVSGEHLQPAIEVMTRSLHHRGPDASGIFVEGPAALGHARLSIIDLTDRAAQPMHSPDRRFVIAYNGELYNFKELRSTLQSSGVRFHSDSDTEVVLQAFIRWGADACTRFNGMFAIAVWDRIEGQLTLMRDRFGIKPLYWSTSGNSFAFASEIKALATSPRFQRALNYQALSEYLYYGNALGTNTMFTDCYKVPPGHIMQVRPGQEPRSRAYWTLADVPSTVLTDEELSPRVRHTLQEAVSRHLVADVPVALFLSGGLDSSTICAFASRSCRGRLKTISVAFEGATASDELQSARLVAKTFGTDHEECRLSFSNMADVFEDIGRAHDQPFGDAGNVPLFILSRKTASSAKVVLQGDGGDELFGGYRRYGLLRNLSLWKWFARLAPVPNFVSARSNLARRLRRMQDALGDPNGAERFAKLLTQEWGDGGLGALLSEGAKRHLAKTDPFAMYREVYGRVSHLEPAQGMMWLDTQILLPDIFLEKVDRSTMANSVEVRVPFLDTELADLVMGLPAECKLRGGSKGLLRRAMTGILPAPIINGPKLGFGVPYSEWLAGPLADFTRDKLRPSNPLIGALFEKKAIDTLCDLHMKKGMDHGFMLYKLLMLAIWAEQSGAQA